jgi:hypothetical protein
MISSKVRVCYVQITIVAEAGTSDFAIASLGPAPLQPGKALLRSGELEAQERLYAAAHKSQPAETPSCLSQIFRDD